MVPNSNFHLLLWFLVVCTFVTNLEALGKKTATLNLLKTRALRFVQKRRTKKRLVGLITVKYYHFQILTPKINIWGQGERTLVITLKFFTNSKWNRKFSPQNRYWNTCLELYLFLKDMHQKERLKGSQTSRRWFQIQTSVFCFDFLVVCTFVTNLRFVQKLRTEKFTNLLQSRIIDKRAADFTFTF